jgi:ribosomal protein S18 acetylase RimI-like enzyme
METPITPEEISQEVSLRKATAKDQRFLFTVIRTAMKPVYEASGQTVSSDEEAFADFQKKFDPNDVSVIQINGEDAGRLRVTRTPEHIFIGGIHLLPEYQGQGVGSSLLLSLIEESESTSLPIILEVRDVNTDAYRLYEKLGFTLQNQRENMLVMQYTPKTLG